MCNPIDARDNIQTATIMKKIVENELVACVEKLQIVSKVLPRGWKKPTKIALIHQSSQPKFLRMKPREYMRRRIVMVERTKKTEMTP
jgi:hypothetical protein